MAPFTLKDREANFLRERKNSARRKAQGVLLVYARVSPQYYLLTTYRNGAEIRSTTSCLEFNSDKQAAERGCGAKDTEWIAMVPGVEREEKG